MKRNFKTYILLVVIVILLIPMGLFIKSYYNYSVHNVKKDCSNDVKKYLLDISDTQNGSSLKPYLEFECDGFYVIGPYTTSPYRHKAIGCKWYNYSSYSNYLFNEILFDGDCITEGQQQLVFVKDNKVVNVATINRSDCDFITKGRTYYSIQTIINIDVTDNGNIVSKTK